MDENILVNQIEYRILNLLGKGKGGYSYLAANGKENYVLKQIHHEPCSYYQFGNKIESEIKDYDRLSKIGIPMPKMIDVDLSKEIIIKEYINGKTIFDLIVEDKKTDGYIEQMTNICKLLYPCNINIDYFPTNFVEQKNILYYIDYECNDYTEEWNFENWGIKYWSKTKEFLQYIKEHN